MRFILFIPILAAALQADPVTIVQTKSASGLTDLFYSYDVAASAGAVTALIHGSATCPGGGCSDGASAAIDLAIELYTSGPARNGIALLQLFTSGDGNGGGTPQISGVVGPYSLGSCAKGLSCSLSGYFPFELGVPFTIDLSGHAYGFPPLGDAGFFASASLQLYELPAQSGTPAGAPVQISLVPEPGSAGLAFSGFSVLILFAVRRRSTLLSI